MLYCTGGQRELKNKIKYISLYYQIKTSAFNRLISCDANLHLLAERALIPVIACYFFSTNPLNDYNGLSLIWPLEANLSKIRFKIQNYSFPFFGPKPLPAPIMTDFCKTIFPWFLPVPSNLCLLCIFHAQYICRHALIIRKGHSSFSQVNLSRICCCLQYMTLYWPVTDLCCIIHEGKVTQVQLIDWKCTVAEFILIIDSYQ